MGLNILGWFCLLCLIYSLWYRLSLRDITLACFSACLFIVYSLSRAVLRGGTLASVGVVICLFTCNERWVEEYCLLTLVQSWGRDHDLDPLCCLSAYRLSTYNLAWPPESPSGVLTSLFMYSYRFISVISSTFPGIYHLSLFHEPTHQKSFSIP